MKQQLTALSLQEIQSHLLEILKVFDTFCTEHKIQYFLCGGTLLGAVRNQGFIPWDDDVDVMMPRPDYEKLFALLGDKLLDNRYELVSITNGKSDIPFAKFQDTDILIQEEITKMNQYLWIDIFSLDALPEDPERCHTLLKRANKLRDYYSMATCPIGTGTTPVKAIAKIPLLLYHRWKNRDNHYAKELIDYCKIEDYESSKYIGGITWSSGPCERMEKKDFFPPVRIQFCGLLLQVSHNYDDYLKNMYGNYWVIPDEKHRKTHKYKALIKEKQISDITDDPEV